jgi:hypothetical protein
MIGKALSPVLVEIEDSLWEFEANCKMKPQFTQEGFRATVKIFMCAMMDKIYDLQENEGIDFETRCKMAEQCGHDLKKLVKTYTNIDTKKLY